MLNFGGVEILPFGTALVISMAPRHLPQQPPSLPFSQFAVCTSHSFSAGLRLITSLIERCSSARGKRMIWRPQRSPTFGPPGQSCLTGSFGKSGKFPGRNISVICPGSCRVTEIQITSCPSKKEFFTHPISVICPGVVPRHGNHF